MCLGPYEFLKLLVNKWPDVPIGITFPFFLFDNEAEIICPRKPHLFQVLPVHELEGLGKQCCIS
jgi:hypothetical protein